MRIVDAHNVAERPAATKVSYMLYQQLQAKKRRRAAEETRRREARAEEAERERHEQAIRKQQAEDEAAANEAAASASIDGLSVSLRRRLRAAPGLDGGGRLPSSSYLRTLTVATTLSAEDREWVGHVLENRKHLVGPVEPSESAVVFEYDGLKPMYEAGAQVRVAARAHAAGAVNRTLPIECSLLGRDAVQGATQVTVEWPAAVGTATMECRADGVADVRLLSAKPMGL